MFMKIFQKGLVFHVSLQSHSECKPLGDGTCIGTARCFLLVLSSPTKPTPTCSQEQQALPNSQQCLQDGTDTREVTISQSLEYLITVMITVDFNTQIESVCTQRPSKLSLKYFCNFEMAITDFDQPDLGHWVLNKHATSTGVAGSSLSWHKHNGCGVFKLPYTPLTD